MSTTSLNSSSTQAIVLANGETLDVGTSGNLQVAATVAVYAGVTASGVVVSNAGTIAATAPAAYGVVLKGGGSVTNQATGTISGYYGVIIDGTKADTATLVNAGTITGTLAAVAFGDVNADLIVDPGASFTGIVGAQVSYSNSSGVVTLSNTLDLASTSSAGVVTTGTIAGIGSEFVNFNTIVEDAGASWVLNGANTVSGQGIVLGANATLSVGANAKLDATGSDAIYASPTASGIVVSNAGTIDASGGFGVDLTDGGSVTNQAGASVVGKTGGIFVANAAGTIDNAGTISTTAPISLGIELSAGGSITNQATGTISGYYGVLIGGTKGDAATVVNAGTITGALAVGFGHVNADLIVDPGASFGGLVFATASYTGSSGVVTLSNTLDLASASSVGTIAGSIGGSGAQYQNFSTVTLGGGADWTLAGAVGSGESLVLGDVGTIGLADPSGFQGTISHLALADTIVLTNDAYNAADQVSLGAGNVLSVTNGASTLASLQLNPTQAYTASDFSLTNVGGNEAITNTLPVSPLTGITDAGIVLGAGETLTVASTGQVVVLNGDAVYANNVASNVGVVNDGFIASFASSSNSYGINLLDGGSVTNAATASIVGYTGVEISGAAGTVSNQGVIASTGSQGAAVDFDAGGSVTNTAKGTITGYYGVDISGAAGTVVNAGTITATGSYAYAVLLRDGGSVTNQAGASISGYYGGVVIRNAAGTVVNDSLITATDTYEGATGVYLTAGGSVTNAARASISGPYGVFVGSNSTGTVVNYGAIISQGGYSKYGGIYGAGVELAGGGSVTNEAGAIISGYYPVLIEGGPGTVVNEGIIASNGSPPGVELEAGGSVTNEAGGSIYGSVGVGINGTAASSPATLVNAGTITGNYGTAARFGDVNAHLTLYPGASFNGTVEATASYTNVGGSIISLSNTLDLASASSAGTLAGSIGGSAAQYQNFQTITLADNADWTLSGTVAVGETLILGNAGVIGLGDTATNPTDFAGTLENLVAGDTIVLTNDAYSSADQVSLGAGNVLSVTSGASTLADLQLAPNASYQASDFSLISAGGQEAITDTIPCFVRGTCIQTARGEVAVEKLRPGDRVAVLGGGFRPIIWIGRRRIAIAHHPRPEKVQPIRIKAGAIADGMPARDLRVSPGHGIYFQRVLIPAEHLLNGVSVVRERVATVEYFHVELDEHAVLFSEGYPSESYLDTGNRHNFAGAGMALHPDFSPRPPKTWRETCTPLVWDGREWLAARRQLRLRLAAFGAIESADPDLHLRLGARRIKAIATTRAGRLTTHRFAIPEGTRTGPLTLASAIAIPGDILPDCADHRPLGIALHRLVFRGRGGATEITLNALARGWYDLEKSAKGACWRWSDGAGELPHLGPGLLECTTATGDLGYLIAPAPPAKQPRAAAMMRRASAQRAKQSNASNPAHTTSVTSEPGDRAFRA